MGYIVLASFALVGFVFAFVAFAFAFVAFAFVFAGVFFEMGDGMLPVARHLNV